MPLVLCNLPAHVIESIQQHLLPMYVCRLMRASKGLLEITQQNTEYWHRVATHLYFRDQLTWSLGRLRYYSNTYTMKLTDWGYHAAMQEFLDDVRKQRLRANITPEAQSDWRGTCKNMAITHMQTTQADWGVVRFITYLEDHPTLSHSRKKFMAHQMIRCVS
jgi:hypothetical protein